MLSEYMLLSVCGCVTSAARVAERAWVDRPAAHIHPVTIQSSLVGGLAILGRRRVV